MSVGGGIYVGLKHQSQRQGSSEATRYGLILTHGLICERRGLWPSVVECTSIVDVLEPSDSGPTAPGTWTSIVRTDRRIVVPVVGTHNSDFE